MWISTSGLILVTSVLLINASIGIVVISRNSRSLLNRWFFVLAISIALWAASSLVSDFTTNYTISRFASCLAFGFSFLAVGSSYIFSSVFLRSKLRKSDRNFVFIYPLISIIFATPLVYDLQTFDTYEFGVLYYPYLLSVLVLCYLIGINFRKAVREGTPIQKSQGKFMLLGIILTIGFALITNAIVPAFADNIEVTKFGPIFSVIFVSMFAYAIIKHRLFDIRLIVARSFAYTLLVGTLGAIYVVIVIGSARLLTGDNPSRADAIPFVAALFVTATAPFFKRFFDKITNRIFYRDAYDPQTFLDTLNKSLVGEIELEILLKNVARIMEENLKSTYCAIGIRETPTRPLRVLGNIQKYTAEDIGFVRSELITLGKKLVVLEDLPPEKVKLAEVFRKNNIEIIARLLTGYELHEESIAYLILGPKKSGNIYNKQDLKLIEIISDELVIAIQNALRFEEIQAFAVTLQDKVDEATAKLRRTNLKLKEMDETKDEFISMASHQLRTPLTSVKGYLSMVLDGDAGTLKPQQKELLEQSFLSSQRMVYIIADLLNVSRLKTGKFVLDINETDLVNVVNGEIAQLHEAFKSKNLKISFTKPDGFPVLMLDETKIRQVIMNFIDNAVYYTPAGGKIWVELKQDKKHVYFTVKDSGLGVPKTEQSHLFGKFYRATNARKARPDGTGLGLFMAKRVVLAQGGSILFESTEGKGSTFGFCFETSRLMPPSTKDQGSGNKSEK